MLLVDVNVLLYAHRSDSVDHARHLAWLEALLNGNDTFGIADQVLSGFLRIATHPKVFVPPSSIDVAIQFADRIRNHPNCVIVAPGPRHWSIFTQLCRDAGAHGNLVPDAFLAALAVESGCEFITTDQGFSRWPGLKWRSPF